MEQSIIFRNTCQSNGLVLSDAQIGRFVKYAGLLLEWNGKVNLISRKDEQNLWSNHFLHCVSPFFVRAFPEQLRVLDIGTGGGLPGIPMAILCEGWKVLLLDSIAKKCGALEDMAGKLGLSNVDVVNGRAEDAAVLGPRRASFDLVVARGVAPLVQLARWSRPYLRGVKLPVDVEPPTDVKHPSQNRGSGSAKAAAESFIASAKSAIAPALLAFKGGELEDELRHLRIKMPAASVESVNLAFPGSAEAGLEGKKLLILQFT